MNRPDLSDRVLVIFAVGLVLGLAVYFAALPWLPRAFQLPGSAPLHLAGVAGSLMLLVSFAFVLAKRTGRGGSPVAWFSAHVIAACAGTVLVAIHSAGRLRYAPALVLLNILALLVLGVWARLRLSRRISATFASKHQSLLDPDAVIRERLADIIGEKEALLARLDAGAREGTFSLTLAHWLRAPSLALAYARLVRHESRLIGTREAVGSAQGYWRWIHIALAYLFVIGLLTHAATTIFFAGYVAGGEEIYWWHLAQW